MRDARAEACDECDSVAHTFPHPKSAYFTTAPAPPAYTIPCATYKRNSIPLAQTEFDR